MSEISAPLVERLKSVQKTIKPGDRTVFEFENVINFLVCPDHGHAHSLIAGHVNNNRGVSKGFDLLAQYDPNYEQFMVDLLIQYDPHYEEYIGNLIFNSPE